jgi:hypothetical protein
MEALQRLHNRGSVSTGPADYDIDNSLKLDSVNSEYLYIHRDASGSDWNRLLWTASMWVKHIPTENSATAPKERMFGAADAQSDFDIRFRGQHGGFRNNSDVDGVAELRTSAVYRDYSAWYHVVAVWDTANATAGNRMRLYVNGEEVTSFSTDTQPSQNEKSTWGKKNDGTDGNVAHTIGAYYNASSGFAQGFNGYMAEVHWVEGEALAPSDFGATDPDTGIWIPQEYTGSHGTNGFYLDFSNSGSLGADASGNGNNWSLNNIAAADQATDTPTNNFCTLNAAVNFKYTTNGVREGGTVFGDDTGGGVGGAFGTMAVSSGKWYWEMKLSQQVSHYPGVSAIDDGDRVQNHSDPHELNSTFNYNISAARREYVNSGTLTYGSLDEFGDFHSVGDIIAIALNMDDNQISIYCNGTLQSGIANSSLFDAANKMCVPFHGTINDEVQYNFGGYSAWTPSSVANDQNGYGTFEYAPPSGYYALCTKNLSEFGG